MHRKRLNSPFYRFSPTYCRFTIFCGSCYGKCKRFPGSEKRERWHFECVNQGSLSFFQFFVHTFPAFPL
uniref:Uncharacterized protein n=1 Tax=Trichuris muris TaxID=70415 RepID=A0A5S6Q0Z2_TRIMR